MSNKATAPLLKRKLLSVFLLFMLACTGISRIYDSIAVPRVRTAQTRKKTVETLVEGSGTVKIKEKQIYPVASGLRLARVEAVPGNEVKAGDLLFQYDQNSIAEQEENLRIQLEAIDLQISKEQIAQEDYPGISQTELARRELDLAVKELEEENAQLAEAREKHKEELDRLAREYETGLARLNDDLWQQQDQAWETAKKELENIQNSRDREIRAAQRKIDNLTEELDQAAENDTNKTQSGEDDTPKNSAKPDHSETYQNLEHELQEAKEDLEALQAAWKVQIEAARTQLELLEAQEERIRAGRTEAQESKKENYENAVRQEEAKMEERQKEIKTFERAQEKAEWDLEAAQKQESAETLAKEQQKRLSALTIRGMELEKKEKQRQLTRFLELKKTNGAVFARETGTIADVELIAGKTTSGEELLTLAAGDCQFEAVFDKDKQKLAKGDKIQISVPGTTRKKEAVITHINLMDEKEGTFQADLKDSELPPGSMATYSCTKLTDTFPMVIPLEGLRKDMKGYYCLVARTHPAILGEEFRAERVNVELLYQGSQEAAVEGTIFDKDQVIIGENKTIHEGDRVRPTEHF